MTSNLTSSYVPFYFPRKTHFDSLYFCFFTCKNGEGGVASNAPQDPPALHPYNSAVCNSDYWWEALYFLSFFTSLIQANYRLYFLRNRQNNLFKQFRTFKFTPLLCSKFAVQLMHANFNLFTFKNFISNCRLSNM